MFITLMVSLSFANGIKRITRPRRSSDKSIKRCTPNTQQSSTFQWTCMKRKMCEAHLKWTSKVEPTCLVRKICAQFLQTWTSLHYIGALYIDGRAMASFERETWKSPFQNYKRYISETSSRVLNDLATLKELRAHRFATDVILWFPINTVFELWTVSRNGI